MVFFVSEIKTERILKRKRHFISCWSDDIMVCHTAPTEVHVHEWEDESYSDAHVVLWKWFGLMDCLTGSEGLPGDSHTTF